jgi:hypothetical protein
MKSVWYLQTFLDKPDSYWTNVYFWNKCRTFMEWYRYFNKNNGENFNWFCCAYPTYLLLVSAPVKVVWSKRYNSPSYRIIFYAWFYLLSHPFPLKNVLKIAKHILNAHLQAKSSFHIVDRSMCDFHKHGICILMFTFCIYISYIRFEGWKIIWLSI